MPISPHLLKKLQEALGADAADDLVNWMDSMDANRGDIAELRHEMQLGFAAVNARFEQVDARFRELQSEWTGRLDANHARLEALIEKGLKEQTRFFFLAWSVLLATILALNLG